METCLRGEIDLIADDFIVQRDGVGLQKAAVKVNDLGRNAAGCFGKEDVAGL